MPDYMSSITLGGICLFLGGISAVLLATKPLRSLTRTLHQIADDWIGVPERRDASGALIAPGRPSIPAQIETLRSQVQNSHSTNLRDDVDKVGSAVKEVSAKLDEHIEIAKQSDSAQERFVGQLERFTPMLEDLHARYAGNNQRGDA